MKIHLVFRIKGSHKWNESCVCLNTKNTLSLFNNDLILLQLVAVEAQEDLANISQRLSFSHIRHLKMKPTISINTSKAAFCKKEVDNAQQCILKCFVLLLLLCLPCLVCQCRKYNLVQKMQMPRGRRTSSKREQWPQASREADTAFEPFKEALMCNL